jgi:hypothetical protein
MHKSLRLIILEFSPKHLKSVQSGLAARELPETPAIADPIQFRVVTQCCDIGKAART